MAVSIRQRIGISAYESIPNVEEANMNIISELSPAFSKLDRKYTRKSMNVKNGNHVDDGEKDRPGLKYKKRKMHQLSWAVKVNICNDILMEHHTTEDTARKFRVSKTLVTVLVNKLKKNHGCLLYTSDAADE